MLVRIAAISVFLMAVFLGASGDVHAQNYCALNRQVSIYEICFDNFGKAEAHL